MQLMEKEVPSYEYLRAPATAAACAVRKNDSKMQEFQMDKQVFPKSLYSAKLTLTFDMEG